MTCAKATPKVWAAAGLAAVLAGVLTACAPDGGDDPEPAGPPAGSGWTAVADVPQQRTELSAVALADQVYVAGGITEDGQLPAELFIYDPATDEWREGAPIPEGRHHAPLAAHDGTVYLVGGFAGAVGEGMQPTDTLFMYDVDTDTWRDGPPLPEPRGAHAVALTGDGQLHVVGGVNDGARDEHFAFDPATETWSTLPPMPTAREHIGAAYHDGTIYVAAGRAGTVSDMQTFEAYDIAAQEWTTLPEMPTGRSGIAVAEFDGQIYVFGGEVFGAGSRTFDEAEAFDPAAGAWQEMPPMPTARHGLGAGVLENGILVVGGGPEPGLSVSGVAEFWQP